MTVISSALLCHVSVSPSQLASDRLLEVVLLKLVSPLQVKVQVSDKAVLSMTLADQCFTQRNVILKTLVGIIGVKQNQTGRPLLSHPTTPFDSAAITAWMSVADSVRKSSSADGFLSNLNAHLETHAFLLPTSHTASLADLDLAVELSSRKLEDCQSHAHICRWLRTCQTMLVQFGCKDISVMESKVSDVHPVLFTGDESETIVFKGSAKGKGSDSTPTQKNRPGQAQGKQSKQQPEQSQQQQQQPTNKPKKEKAKKNADQPKQPQSTTTAEPATFDISALDIRVGKITKAWHHPDAEKLFCEEIDLGTEVRQIASGLRPFYETKDLVDRNVLVLCNLKKRNLVGFASHGMVLCASNAEHTQVKFVDPPVSAKPGDRVTFEQFPGEPEPDTKVAKKKIFEAIAPDLKTNDKGVVVWKGSEAKVAGDLVTAELTDAHVS